MPGHAPKRAKNETGQNVKSSIFYNFAFYFHGSIPGGSVQTRLLREHGGEVVGVNTLKWALEAACPIAGKAQNYGTRGRLEVVVVIGKNLEKSKALGEIKDLLEQPELLCSKCGTCHLASISSSAEGVQFVHESIQMECAQTHLVGDLEEARVGGGGGDAEGDSLGGVLTTGKRSSREIVISDGDSEQGGGEEEEGNEGAISVEEEDTVPSHRRGGWGRGTSRGGEVVLKHIECASGNSEKYSSGETYSVN